MVMPVISFIFLIFLIILGLYQSPRQFGVGVLIIISGIPVYWICVCWRQKPDVFENTMSKYEKYGSNSDYSLYMFFSFIDRYFH